MKTKELVLILIFLIPTNIYGSGVRFKGKYIPVDLLSQTDCLCLVALDIQTKKIDFQIDNQTLTFTQENELDSTQLFVEQSLFSRFENEYTLLRISELLQVDSDSIFVSATYQQFNKRGNIGKIKKIEKLGICKSNLLGVIILPPTKEIKKRNKAYIGIFGTLGVAIVTLSIIFGGT